MDASGERTWSALLLEFEHLQATIERFDGHRQRTRAWLITVFTATAALALQQRSAAIGVLAPVAALLFFLLEMVYMSHEALLINRSNAVERLIDGLRRSPNSAASIDYRFGYGAGIEDHELRLRDVVGLVRHREHILWFYGGVAFAATSVLTITLIRT